MEGFFLQLLLPVHLLDQAALPGGRRDHELKIRSIKMDSSMTIQIFVARADLFLVTAGYILVRVLIIVTVIICIAGIVIIIRSYYRGN